MSFPSLHAPWTAEMERPGVVAALKLAPANNTNEMGPKHCEREYPHEWP